jgi:hypothetical protein
VGNLPDNLEAKYEDRSLPTDTHYAWLGNEDTYSPMSVADLLDRVSIGQLPNDQYINVVQTWHKGGLKQKTRSQRIGVLLIVQHHDGIFVFGPLDDITMLMELSKTIAPAFGNNGIDPWELFVNAADVLNQI